MSLRWADRQLPIGQTTFAPDLPAPIYPRGTDPKYGTSAGMVLGPWPARWSGSEVGGARGLGGFLDGDGEAEGLQLADVVADLAVAADAVVVVAGSEVAEPGGGVGEQVVDDDQDGAGDGGQGLAFAPAPGQAAVTLAEEGVGAGGGGGDLAEDAVEGMRPMIGSARLLRLSKDRPTSPACFYWWHGPTRGGSRFRLTQTKTDRLGSSPCRNMKSGWHDPLLFCPPQICFRSSTKSASKLGMAQTTPDRAKSRSAGRFSNLRKFSNA